MNTALRFYYWLTTPVRAISAFITESINMVAAHRFMQVNTFNLTRLEGLVAERSAGGVGANPDFVAGTLSLARSVGLQVTAVEEGIEQSSILRQQASLFDKERVRVIDEAQKRALQLGGRALANRDRAATITSLLGLMPPSARPQEDSEMIA